MINWVKEIGSKKLTTLEATDFNIMTKIYELDN